MKKQLEEIKNIQDFKIYLDYPRIPENQSGAGLFEQMRFNTCKNNPESLISWLKKENELYLIRVSKECLKHIKKPRYGIGGLPMMCEDLRFVKGVNTGITKDGYSLISIEILMPGEISEQEEYSKSRLSKDEVYKQMREESYGNRNYEDYNGSYAQDYAGFSDQQIDDIFDGDPDLYWNID